MSDGLRAKYIVQKAETGEAVEDCFVLRPGKDPAAVAAIWAYAAVTDNAALSDDLLRWVGTPPNNPLTLNELREMDGEPVWLKDGTCYLVRLGFAFSPEYECDVGIDKHGRPTSLELICHWGAFRRKPEET